MGRHAVLKDDDLCAFIRQQLAVCVDDPFRFKGVIPMQMTERRNVHPRDNQQMIRF